MSRLLRLPVLYHHGAIVLLLLELACHKKQVAVPLPPPPAAASQPHTSEQSTPPAQDSSTSPTGSAATGTPQQSPYQVNKPAQPSPAAPRKASRSTTAPSQSPGSPAPTPAPAQPPVLGDIVTPDQQRQLNTAIDQSLSHAQASLASIPNKELSKNQQGLVEQIRNLIQQAQGARTSDLPGAKSLAERAEVLAKDLAGSFR